MVVRNRLARPGFASISSAIGAGVAGDDHHEVVAVVLHRLDQRVDGLLAVLVPGQRVGLVDEQHALDRAGDHLGGLHGGLAEVAGDQLGAVHLDQVPLGQHAERRVDAADQSRDGGLAGARVAGEHQVPGDRRGAQALLGAQPLHPQHGGLPVHLCLDRAQPDQAVELGEQLLDGGARLLGRRGQGGGRRRGGRRGGGGRGGRRCRAGAGGPATGPVPPGTLPAAPSPARAVPRPPARPPDHAAELRGRGHRRVADHAQRRLTEPARRRADLDHGPGIGLGLRGPGRGELPEQAGRRLPPPPPARGASKNAALPPAVPVAVRPVGRGARGRLGQRGSQPGALVTRVGRG